MAGQQGRDYMAWRRQLRQPGDDGGIDAATESDDEAGAAGGLKTLPHPAGETLRGSHAEIVRGGQSGRGGQGR